MISKVSTTKLTALALAAALSGIGCGGQDEPSFRPTRASAEDRRAVHVEAPPARGEPAHGEAPHDAVHAGLHDTEAAAPVVEAQAAAPVDPRLLNPSQLNERAPERFVAELDTTEGPVRIEVTRAWSPAGADRFYNLVRAGYYTDVAFFRVIEGFMAQVGIHGSPQVNAAWRSANIPDDPPQQHNTRGMVSYAMAGPGTRTTQFFINFGDNSRLDSMGFAPFGRVLDMAVVDRLYAGYGEGSPGGRGPAQARLQSEGNAYLRAQFPELDYIRSARILPASAASGGPEAAPRRP